jgi:hypothetical protein
MRIRHGARRTRLLALAAVLLAAIVVSTGLAFSSASAQTVSATLVWTAPGDDGTIGRATQYDLRISTSAISGTDTLSWWNAATIVSMAGKVPALSGALDSMVVTTLLPSTRYYAIIRAADEVPNWSGYSNVAVIDTRDLIAPVRITDLRAR